MFFYIEISSKNKAALQKFLSFILKLNKTNLTIVPFSQQTVKKFVTILKSPHINKSAQEQFEFRVYTKKLLISSTQFFKFFYLIKKLQNVSFPGINVKIKGLFEKKKNFRQLLNVTDPDNLDLNFLNKLNCSLKSIGWKTKKYVQMFDNYGEQFLKTKTFMF